MGSQLFVTVHFCHRKNGDFLAIGKCNQKSAKHFSFLLTRWVLFDRELSRFTKVLPKFLVCGNSNEHTQLLFHCPLSWCSRRFSVPSTSNVD